MRCLLKKKLLCVVLTMMFCFMNIATALASFERGDEGQEVIDIQKRLVELQYKVSNVDGNRPKNGALYHHQRHRPHL